MPKKLPVLYSHKLFTPIFGYFYLPYLIHFATLLLKLYIDRNIMLYQEMPPVFDQYLLLVCARRVAIIQIYNIIQIITVAGKGLWRDKQYAHKYILFFWIFVLRYSFQYVVYVVREVFCSSRSTIFLILGFLKDRVGKGFG